MAKFVFKMQSILNLKLQVEESLKDELGKAVQKLEYEKARLKAIEDEREECISQVTGSSGKGITVGKLKEYSSYISLLKERIELQKENVAYAEDIVDKYREQLIKAVQERKMFEKLKEKKYEEFIKEQQKEEQRINDEVVSFNFGKNASEAQ